MYAFLSLLFCSSWRWSACTAASGFSLATMSRCLFFFFFQAEDGIRDRDVTGVQTCALPICGGHGRTVPDRAAYRWRGVRRWRDSRGGGGVDGRSGDRACRRVGGRGQDVERSEERRVGKEWRSGWALDK